ncbi:MAG: hypothetical protein R2691_07185 [Solirubrobacterales bacterium]
MIKAMMMSTAIVLVGYYYRLHGVGRPGRSRDRDRKGRRCNASSSCIIGMMGTLVFWGANPRAPIGG